MAGVGGWRDRAGSGQLPRATRSGGPEIAGEACEQLRFWTRRGEGDPHPGRRLSDARGDLEQPHPQGCGLGAGQWLGLWDRVPQLQHEPVGAGVQHEAHLIGERRAATGAVRCKLGLVERFGWTFCPGDKVMEVANDDDRDVFNGDRGLITGIDTEEGTLTVSFDGREVEYGFGELDELVLAYATTILKAQGSEYPVVVIPLVTQHYAMLARNLLYIPARPAASGWWSSWDSARRSRWQSTTAAHDGDGPSCASGYCPVPGSMPHHAASLIQCARRLSNPRGRHARRVPASGDAELGPGALDAVLLDAGDQRLGLFHRDADRLQPA